MISPDISRVCSHVRQNVGPALDLHPRSGERGYDSVSRNSQVHEISGLGGSSRSTSVMNQKERPRHRCEFSEQVFMELSEDQHS